MGGLAVDEPSTRPLGGRDADERVLEQLGYEGELKRVLKSFDSFGLSFSNSSVTTGVVLGVGATYGLAGPAGIWVSLLCVVLMFATLFVYTGLAARFPLTGLEYQWASRMAGALTGSGVGWLMFAVQTISVVAVDYAIASGVLPGLFDYTSGSILTMLVTTLILLVQAVVLATSVKATARVNSTVVVAELAVIVGIVVLLLVVGLIRGMVDVHNLWNTAGTGHGHYFALAGHGVGPFFATIAVAFFTIGTGFQGAGNGAEETHDPRRTIPRAMTRTLVVVMFSQMAMLIVLALVSHDVPALANSATPVPDIISRVLGSVVSKIFLAVVVFCIFACGMIILYQQVRYAWAMARDGRFPGGAWLAKINPRTKTPLWATALCAVVSLGVLFGFASNSRAFDDLSAASGLVMILGYAAIVLISLRFDLGRMRKVAAGVALAWFAFALATFRSGFTSAWEYTAAMVALGVVFVAVSALSARRSTPADELASRDPAETVVDRSVIGRARR